MVKTAKTFKLTHVGGHFSHFTIVSDASKLVKRHKYFGRRYAPGIQRWGFDPTNRISLKGSRVSFSLFFITAQSLQRIQISKLTNHQIIHHTFKKSLNILKNFEDQFLLQFT